ncbi:MAG: tripartite tricarboxylate transporter substrate binding protein [Candidatus Rokubacteria bacterium]|nr:tripartite tricarboxylate transporter substrate binding protein [Candidatus Rokubacteria bacterium]
MVISVRRIVSSAVMLAFIAPLGIVPLPARAVAQDFPTKPVRVIIPYPAGGATDLTSRAFVSVAEQYLGQPMIVVIRSGGGGAVGAEAAAKSRPDGYTLFIGDPATHIILPQVQKVAYNPADFVPIGQLVSLPAVLSVRTEAPWKTAREFIEDAKANPGKIKHSAVTFSPEHLMFEAMGVKYRAKFTHVPSTGGGPALASLLGGHVDANGLYPPVVFPHIQAGKLRALGVGGPKRWPAFPDTPTLREQGFDLEARLWLAVFAPKGTPEPVLAKLRDAVKKIADDTSFKTLMSRMGQQVDYLSAEDLAKQWAADQVALKAVIEQIAR